MFINGAAQPIGKTTAAGTDVFIEFEILPPLEAKSPNGGWTVRADLGRLPDALLVLAAHARIRMLAERLRAEHVDRDGQTIVVRFRQDAPLDPTRLAAFVSRRPDLRLVPPGALVFDLAAPRAATKPVGRGTGAVGPRRAQDRSAVSWWTSESEDRGHDARVFQGGHPPPSPGGPARGWRTV